MTLTDLFHLPLVASAAFTCSVLATALRLWAEPEGNR